jgi:hypothetical protein
MLAFELQKIKTKEILSMTSGYAVKYKKERQYTIRDHTSTLPPYFLLSFSA